MDNLATLATVLDDQSKYEEAEEMSRQALGLRETMVLGKEHPSTLTSMNNLALVYWNGGRWDEAEKLEIQVMEMRVRMLGQEHPLTLTSMANLAYMEITRSR